MESLLYDLQCLLTETCKCSASADLESLNINAVSNERQLVDIANWIRYARVYLSQADTFDKALEELEKSLAHRTFLVSDTLSYADVAVWSRLQCTDMWLKMCEASQKKVPSSTNVHANLQRLCGFISSQEGLKNLAIALSANLVPLNSSKPKSAVPVESKKRSAKDMKFEEGGKFADLPGAKMGEVVVRFPPEASGFMHIGHAKAALLNFHYKETFNGKLLLRFDDTNPTKETVEFEDAILADLPRLGVHWDSLSYTSDYFDLMIDLCTQMIKDGFAYADDTDAETMKAEREQRQASVCRNNSVEKNLAWWKEMQDATAHGLKTCIRAKIDMTSDNGAMRDPTIYRCKLDPHIRTGSRYKVFPIYDFACPIVDSVEGVTHALRTSEYNDRNDQFYWMCDALKIRKPLVIDYSRLALQSTLLSKRKLTWFVQEGLVAGWDDPRMPTVRGILRHGLTPEGLRQFILAQGSSKSTGTMEWDKIWAFNKKVIDPVAPRYTGLLMDGKRSATRGLVPVKVKGQDSAEIKMTPLHPKNTAVGEKTMVVAPVVFVEAADADCFIEGENVTFVNWGNLRVLKLHMGASGGVTAVDCETNLEDTDFKKTQKVTWLADPDQAQTLDAHLTKLTPLSCVTYGSLISKPLIAKTEDFKEFVNLDSITEDCCLGDPQMRHLKKGDIVQIQRKGFYICDEPYMTSNPATGKESPCVLFYIPDGAVKVRPTTGSKFKAAELGDTVPSAPPARPAGKTKRALALNPEEEAKQAEKERLKEEKKAARKAGREKAKQQVGGAPVIPAVVDAEPSPTATTVTAAPVQQIVAAAAATTTTVVDQSAPAERAAAKSAKQPKPAKAPKPPKQAKPKEAPSDSKKQTRLGLEAKKEEDTAEWYTQVITKAELLEYYDVSGCYILRPWSFFIWSQIQAFFDKAIADMGVENAYFPMFVSKGALEREKDHIADFAPEVAWVTRSGNSDLAEPIALRPTSETIMYPAFAKWIQSHRDLPLKINQWSNIVRWEFKHPTPFLRTREFLWQEGHTAFAKQSEAEQEVLEILDLYHRVYLDLLAIPAIKGRKTEREKFPGGDYTTTVEVYIGANGRAIQGATSHHLGQNFSKIFDVAYEDPETKQTKHVYQNSWGLTTRTIGVMIMVHSDNQGLVLPPRVAKYQVVVVPCGITAKTTEADRAKLVIEATDVAKSLRDASDLRVHLDDRDHVSPGWKFNHWELKGVPVRVEIGFKDLAAQQVTAVIRYTGEKRPIALSQLNTAIPKLLDEVHYFMLTRAAEEQLAHIVSAVNMKGLIAALDKKYLIVAPFCGDPQCEDCVRDESAKHVAAVPGAPSMGAKSLCIPFEGEIPGLMTGPVADGSPCLRHPTCTKPATFYTLFGRSY